MRSSSLAFTCASVLLAGCLNDRAAPQDGPRDQPLLDEPSWSVSEDRVSFGWLWDGDVDAFNAIVARDGAPDPQIELGEESRVIVVDARGAKVVSLSVQACSKGFLKSTCTSWSNIEARPPR